ncbi:MAG: IS21-like element helper ATPase IstB [Rhodocyclaceae bacterium]|nr:IS21-like element helper ATPase IstB [Rhodocyclaceae bacterium]
MMFNTLISDLRELRLTGMAAAVQQQMEQPSYSEYSFEQRLGMLVTEERNHRNNRRLQRLLKEAKFKNPNANVATIDYGTSRGLDKGQMQSLITCDWVRQGQPLLITGATGCGKTWLSCALGIQCCSKGFSVLYRRMPRLIEEFEIAHGDGSLVALRQKLAKADLLIIDDWGLKPMSQLGRNDLMEIIEDRVGVSSVLIAAQLPTEQWHDYIGEPMVADAILDRLLNGSHRISLRGESMRKVRTKSG